MFAADDAAATAVNAATFDDAAVFASCLAALATVLVADDEDAIPVASPSSSLSSTNRRLAVANDGADAADGTATGVGRRVDELVDVDSDDVEGDDAWAGSVFAAVAVGRTYE